MEHQITLLAFLITGFAMGAIAIWLILRSQIASDNENQLEIARLNERFLAVQDENVRYQQTISQSDRQLNNLRIQLGDIQNQRAQLAERAERVIPLEQQLEKLTLHQQALTAKIAELTVQLESERTQSGEKIALLNEAKIQLSDQFKALANDILEEKSKRFTEQNQTNIDQILSPLKVKLQEFQSKVEEVYVQEGKDRSSLSEQVKHLMALNKQMSQDAHDLTTALKGQAKTQGNWGEFILERVLENSGLNKGEHYKTQESHSREDGTRAQPDVIIYLPEGRHLVVDAKVSIVAYNDHANADNDLAKDVALKRHIDSIRSHIKGLSSKNYQEIYQLKSLDFVIMFVPVEPAFMLAIAEDSELWQDAWTKNVLLVSPSTLLFVVRTVAHLWRQEQQTRNAQDIAKRGGELYDKLVGFVDDFEKIGDKIRQAQKSYDDAYGKFTGGRGNVIRQAQMLRDLGVKPTKSLPANIVELALEEDATANLLASGE